MKKEKKEEFTNDKTLSDILGIPAKKELVETKLKKDDLSYIRQSTKDRKKKEFNPIRYIITSLIIIIVIIALYFIIF